MIQIGKLRYVETNGFSRIETTIVTDGRNDFQLYIEVEEKYGKYLVTDRIDAFVVGILTFAMWKGHDIKCEDPISSELKFTLENQLIHTLAKHDSSLYCTKIYAPVTDTPIHNEGAVGTGISLGLDSFNTIAEHCQSGSKDLRLTHLVTFDSGAVGGSYGLNGWDFCAQKLYERIKDVSIQLQLPLISMNTNLHRYNHPRVDVYISFRLIMMAMALGKLFRAYFISSNGEDFSCFNVKNTGLKDCSNYELLTIYCCSIQNGVRFLSGGGEKDRLEKLRTIADFPIARENLQSCLTEYYNCMNCAKCKRNLVSLDALGILDKFDKVYDITYYRAHRDEYMEWMCNQVQMENTASGYIMPAYNIIQQREPELIKKHTVTQENLFLQRNELRRQRDVYREYTLLFRKMLSDAGWHDRMKKWFQERNIKKIIMYKNSIGTILLYNLREELDIEITHIVENVKEIKPGQIPRIPENAVEYPACDAVIISSVDKPQIIHRKLKDFVKCPIYEIKDVLEAK